MNKINMITTKCRILNNQSFNKKEIYQNIKVKVYKAVLESTLFFGINSWALSKQSQIAACEMKILRKFARVAKMVRLKNVK